MKSITPAQAIVLVASLAAMIVANKMFGSDVASMIVGAAGMLINFLLGREDDKPKPATVISYEVKLGEGGASGESKAPQLSLFEGGKK